MVVASSPARPAGYRRPVLVLVRHGQTDANARGLLLGRADPPLSELGSPPGRRARRPGAGDGAGGGQPAGSHPGDGGGVRPAGRRSTIGGSSSTTAPSTVSRWPTCPPTCGAPGGPIRTSSPAGASRCAALGVRVRAACEDLLDEARDRDVIVVSHVSPIKAALAWALGVGDDVGWRMFVRVASIARVGIGPWGPEPPLVQRGGRGQLNAGTTSAARSRRWSRSWRSSTWK